MKICPYCGEEIQNTARKCRYCGEFLDKKISTEENHKGRINWKLVLFILFILILLFVCYLFYKQKTSSKWIGQYIPISVENSNNEMVNGPTFSTLNDCKKWAKSVESYSWEGKVTCSKGCVENKCDEVIANKYVYMKTNPFTPTFDDEGWTYERFLDAYDNMGIKDIFCKFRNKKDDINANYDISGNKMKQYIYGGGIGYNILQTDGMIYRRGDIFPAGQGIYTPIPGDPVDYFKIGMEGLFSNPEIKITCTYGRDNVTFEIPSNINWNYNDPSEYSIDQIDLDYVGYDEIPGGNLSNNKTTNTATTIEEKNAECNRIGKAGIRGRLHEMYGFQSEMGMEDEILTDSKHTISNLEYFYSKKTDQCLYSYILINHENGAVFLEIEEMAEGKTIYDKLVESDDDYKEWENVISEHKNYN